MQTDIDMAAVEAALGASYSTVTLLARFRG
jgi:hypothetical protein